MLILNLFYKITTIGDFKYFKTKMITDKKTTHTHLYKISIFSVVLESKNINMYNK